MAGELENPFNGDANDLDLVSLQVELNDKLRAICGVHPDDVPRLMLHPDQAAHRVAKSRKSKRAHTRRKSQYLSISKPMRCSGLTHLRNHGGGRRRASQDVHVGFREPGPIGA